MLQYLPPVVITAWPEMFCAMAGALVVMASIMLIHAARTEVGFVPPPRFWVRHLLVALPAALTTAAASAFVAVLFRAPGEVDPPSDTRNAALLGVVLTIVLYGLGIALALVMRSYGKRTRDRRPPPPKPTRIESRPAPRRQEAPACSPG